MIKHNYAQEVARSINSCMYNCANEVKLFDLFIYLDSFFFIQNTED